MLQCMLKWGIHVLANRCEVLCVVTYVLLPEVSCFYVLSLCLMRIACGASLAG